MRYLLALSDAHLATVPKREGAWLAHRQRPSLVDAELSDVITSGLRSAAAERAELEIVLNGDMFDLDGPIDERPGTTRRADAAAREMMRVLADHPLVVRALADVLRSGQLVILVPGNHDSQLALFPVRRAVTGALAANGAPPPTFRSWFHRTPDGVHVEHGHQYDPLCAHDRPFGLPNADGILAMEPTVANLVSGFAQSHLGTMNPHASDPSALVNEAVRSLGTSAALDPRRLAPSIALSKLLRDVALVRRTPMDDAERLTWCRIVSREIGEAKLGALWEHSKLASAKSDATALLTLADAPSYGAATDARLRAAMREICRIYPASAVVFGHTHIPFEERHRTGALLVNGGSWAPAAPSPDHTVEPRVGAAPAGTFVWLGTSGGRVVTGGVRGVPRRPC